MITLKSTFKLIAVSILLITFNNAHAALVKFTLTGEVTTDMTGDGSNAFGLAVTDPLTTITANGFFETSLDIYSGTHYIAVSDMTSLNITVGNQIFTASDDNGSGLLTIIDGDVLDGFDDAGFYYAGTNSNGHVLTTSTALDKFYGNDTIIGNWTNYSMTVVPVPAAVWLFGSGLLGLVGMARRKSA